MCVRRQSPIECTMCDCRIHTQTVGWTFHIKYAVDGNATRRDCFLSACELRPVEIEAVKMAFSLLLLFAIILCEWCDLICDMNRWQADENRHTHLSFVSLAYNIRCVVEFDGRFYQLGNLYAWHDFTKITRCTHTHTYFPFYWWTNVSAAFANTFRSAFIEFQQRTDSCMACIKRTDGFMNSFVESVRRRIVNAALAIINGI